MATKKQAEEKSLAKAETKIQHQPVTTKIKGLEGIDQDLITIPRIKLVQSMSVEATDMEISPGSLVNSITKEVLAKKAEPMTFIPLMTSRSRVLYASLDSDKMFLCRSQNGKDGMGDPGGYCPECPMSKWGDDGSSPKCTDFINVAVIPILEDGPSNMPMVLSFGRTSYGTGKQLINFLFYAQKSPWHNQYQLFSKQEKNDKGTFFVLKVTPAGKTDGNLIDMYEQAYNFVTQEEVVFHEDEEEMKAEKEKMSNAGDDEDDMPF